MNCFFRDRGWLLLLLCLQVQDPIQQGILCPQSIWQDFPVMFQRMWLIFLVNVSQQEGTHKIGKTISGCP